MKMLGYVGSCLLFRVTMLLGDLNVCFFFKFAIVLSCHGWYDFAGTLVDIYEADLTIAQSSSTIKT